MSKLFDQLKDAARNREEKSPGLLVDALRRQQEASAAGEAATGEPVPPVDSGGPVTPGAPQEQRAGAQPAAPLVTPAKAGPQASASRFSQYSGVGLAIIIFAVAVLAWRAAPWSPPLKHRIDPSELRLDRTLDLQRAPSKGTSPAERPS